MATRFLVAHNSLDIIARQEPIDEARLRVEDNLEEFRPLSDATLSHFRDEVRDTAIGRLAA